MREVSKSRDAGETPLFLFLSVTSVFSTAGFTKIVILRKSENENLSKYVKGEEEKERMKMKREGKGRGDENTYICAPLLFEVKQSSLVIFSSNRSSSSSSSYYYHQKLKIHGSGEELQVVHCASSFPFDQFLDKYPFFPIPDLLDH